MKLIRLVPAVMLMWIGLAWVPVVANASPGGHIYNCTGGNVPPGTYDGMIVSGVCYVPAGTVDVQGNLTILPGALLDGAGTFGDPVAAPVLPGTLLVGGNVRVGTGAVLAIGCSPMGGCPGVTYDRIDGNLVADSAQAVLVQSVAIGGNVSIVGGGGVVGGPGSFGCFDPAAAIPAPWSEDPALAGGSPQYTDVEDSTIGGNFTISDVQSCFVASFRDQIGGSVTFSNNVTSDGDGNELGSNLIGGNLTCASNDPAVQFGDSGASPNMVGGSASGDCGFNVMQPNPTITEHVSVPTSGLQKYTGTHVETANLATIPFGTTASNDALLVEFNTALLTGSGLTGSVASGDLFGPGGEATAITVFPDGSQAFQAFDTCACSLAGSSGTVLIEAYGTTTPNGKTTGRFLIRSGGDANGGLSTIAGYGTFTSAGQPQGTLRLSEQLGPT